MSYIPKFISSDEEKLLFEHIQNLDWQEIALFGQIAKRRVVHFGLNYHYANRTVKPTKPPAEFLNEVIARGANLLKKPTANIAEVLITEYPINAGINWHRDAPLFKDIIGISLNSCCTIHFRNRMDKKEQFKLHLEQGSAYILQDAIRWDWEHRIAPVKILRYSITLRTLK